MIKNIFLILCCFLAAFLICIGYMIIDLARQEKQELNDTIVVWQLCNFGNTGDTPCRVYPDSVWLRTDAWHEVYYTFTLRSDPTKQEKFSSNNYILKQLELPKSR